MKIGSCRGEAGRTERTIQRGWVVVAITPTKGGADGSARLGQMRLLNIRVDDSFECATKKKDGSTPGQEQGTDVPYG